MTMPFVPIDGSQSAGRLLGLRGFTLIELLITLVVIGILAAIALPSYQQYMFRSRRADATSALNSLQLAQERYRANQPSYAASMSTLGVGSSTSPQGHYTIAIAASGETGYTLTALANSSSPQDRDTDCRKFELKMLSGNTTYAGYKSDLSTTNDKCWAK
ncbi:type IV pilin protein [Paucibacter sp. JuS9]|uniref:type IV pilin protein n=1 Tax=Roseateles TaxID=93681 RepID=UPI002FE65E76